MSGDKKVQKITLRLEEREMSMVLAALRLAQSTMLDRPEVFTYGYGCYADIATNCDSYPALDPDEIDALCEYVNGGEDDG